MRWPGYVVLGLAVMFGSYVAIDTWMDYNGRLRSPGIWAFWFGPPIVAAVAAGVAVVAAVWFVTWVTGLQVVYRRIVNTYRRVSS